MQATLIAGNCEDEIYEDFLKRINDRFQKEVAANKEPLFTTSAAGSLFAAYLGSFPVAERQYHNCNACRHFIEKYGSLAVIRADGSVDSAVWREDDAPYFYQAAVVEMRKLVRRAKITGVFLSPDKTWGIPVTGIWKHFYLHSHTLYHRRDLTAGQVMAEKKEDYRNVSRALADFSPSTVEQALRLLKADTLYRSDKVLAPVQWLYDLHKAAASGCQRSNVVWRAVALAPAGFCHPRSSMAGTLLEDIASGMDFDAVSARFKEKMHPLRYLRPQAAPSAGNIEQAEKLVEKLGIARSLERRFARLEEVTALWRPAPAQAPPSAGGVFGHLKAQKAPAPLRVPASVITWDKFSRTVLPEARKVEVKVPSRGDFIGSLTAVHADAPPILRWDSEDRRNPVSWYRYHGGSLCARFNLAVGWVAATAACMAPATWIGHTSPGAMFILEGAADQMCDESCLFPEILRAELHAVRATIEAHSKKTAPAGREQASACGINVVGAHVCVDGIEYKIDRWD